MELEKVKRSKIHIQSTEGISQSLERCNKVDYHDFCSILTHNNIVNTNDK